MNIHLQALLGLLTVYEDLAKGGAKAEADKLINVLVPLATAASTITGGGA